MFTFEFGKFDTEKLKFQPHELDFIAKKGEAAVFDNILNQALGLKFPQGIDGRTQRTLMRILEKLDKAVFDSSIKLEHDERDLIAECFADDIRFPAPQTRMISHIRLAIAKMSPEAKVTPEANGNGC